MKILKSLFVAAVVFNCSLLPAQITITQNDLPNVNDTIRISVNTSLNGFQPALTGAGYLWDYSFLIPDSQRVISHVSPASTAYAFPYSLLATYGVYNNTPDQFPFSLVGVAPTNVYDFYKKNSSSLSIVGQGMNIGGTAVPALMNNTPDRIYKFPMHYQDLDSTNSGFAFPLPNIGYYQKRQKRVNEVDGWGTLVTPYGTFNTLRVKSTLTITDSIYLDTVQFGFTIPRQLQYEYKWLAAGKKVPILEIDVTQNIAGGLTIDRVNWRDSVIKSMSVSFTGQSSCPVVQEGSLTAHMSGGRYPLKYLWNTGDTTATITHLNPGLYTVTVTDRYGNVVQASDSVKTRNDSTCAMSISFVSTSTCPMAKNGTLAATVTNGRNPVTYSWNTGETSYAISGLAPGEYILTVTDTFGRQVTDTAMVEGNFQDVNCLYIPNAFTPDGDGVNDVWNIRSLKDFDKCKVEVFNQWGSLVFRSTGYVTPWDGKYNNEPVPAGAYYYVISLNNTSDKYTGTITVVK